MASSLVTSVEPNKKRSPSLKFSLTTCLTLNLHLSKKLKPIILLIKVFPLIGSNSISEILFTLHKGTEGCWSASSPGLMVKIDLIVPFKKLVFLPLYEGK